MTAETVLIEYRITKDSGEELSFDVEIDGQNQSNPPALISSDNLEWARLKNHQCFHCPLSDEIYCPVALRIGWIVESLQNAISTENVDCQVKTRERITTSRLPMQKAIYSLLGLLMATSGCPHMDFLKPMARYHLPFSNAEETIVRTASFYLLTQYFKENLDEEEEADYRLAHLEELYQAVSEVNVGIINRIRSRPAQGDADRNSIIALDSFAQILSFGDKIGINSVAKSFV